MFKKSKVSSFKMIIVFEKVNVLVFERVNVLVFLKHKQDLLWMSFFSSLGGSLSFSKRKWTSFERVFFWMRVNFLP